MNGRGRDVLLPSLTYCLVLFCAGACVRQSADSGVSNGQEMLAGTATPVSGPCLAVQVDLWEAQPALFANLQRNYPGCSPGPVEGSNEAIELLDLGQSSLAIVSGAAPRGAAELLRTEPFVLVSHVAGRSEGLSVKLVQQIFTEGGDWVPVVVGDGLANRELLGIDGLAPESIYVSSWLEARQLVMTNQRLVTLLPWELVDFKVRALAVQGQPSVSEVVDIGVYERRWWLAGDVEAWPLLAGELRERLRYKVDPLVSMVAVGDVMLGRGVASLMAANSPAYPFLRSGELTRGTDIAFGNLECAITSEDAPQGGISLRGGPEAAWALGEAGFDVLSLANNHADDYGAVGLADTVHYLQKEDIACAGLGAEGVGNGGSVILERGGLKIAFLAFNHVGPQDALRATGGPKWLDPEVAYEEVRQEADQADFVVVSLHWGREYLPLPNEFQQRVAEGMLEAGAGLVLGHHPHVVGTVAFEDEGLVAYSLGNYVFDQPFSVETMQGLALRALIDRSGLKQVEFLPVEIVTGQPVLLPRAEANAVLAGLFRFSEAVGGLPVAGGEAVRNAPSINGLQIEWATRLPGQVMALRLHDLEGNGRLGMVVAAGPRGGPNSVNALDENGSRRWEYTLGEQINGLECGDLDGDGQAEVVVATGLLDRAGEILALDGEGRLRWRFGVEASVLDVALGSVDGDSALEVAAGEWGAFGDTIYLLDGEGHLLWKRPTRGSVHSVAIGDLDRDGPGEVLAGADDVYVLGAVGGLLWRYPTASYLSQVSVSLQQNAAVNNVVAAARYPDPVLSILDANGGLVWSQGLDASPSVVVAEDLDPDGGTDVLLGGLDGTLYLLDGDGTLRWERRLAGAINDLELGDLDGNGVGEVVVATGGYLPPGGLYVLESLTGSVLASYTGLEEPALAQVRDMDQNGSEEIVMASGEEVRLLSWPGGGP